MPGVMSALLVVAGLGAGALGGADPSSVRAAPDEPPARLQRGGIGLELIEQSFTLRPGTPLRLVYRLTGDLPGVAELVPTTTAPPTAPTTAPATAPATTAPPTTVGPPTTAPTDDAAPAPTTVPPPTTEPVPTTTIPPPPQLTINIANFEPITRVEADDPYLDRILGQRAVAGAYVGNVDGVQLSDVRPNIFVHDDGTATLTVVIPTDVDEDDQSGPDSLEFPEPGIYPIRVQLLIDDDLAATHGTVVERTAARDDFVRPSEPVTLSLVANVDRPTAPGGSVDRADTQFARVVTLATAVESPILAAVPPAVLSAALAADDAGRVADALADDELAAMTIVPLDVSAAVAAGQGDVFTEQLFAGEDAMSNELPTTFSGRDVWIASEPLSGAGAQHLRDLGFRFIVMTPQLYASMVGDDRPSTDRFVEIALPDGGSMPTLLVDSLGEELTDRATEEILAAATPTEWAVRTVTEIVLEHRRSGRTVRRSRLLTAPNLDAPNPELIVALELMATTTPDVRFLAASALPGVTDTQGVPSGVVRVWPDVAGPSLIERIDNISRARLELASAASMLVDGDDRLADWNAVLDALVTTGISDAEANETIDGLRDGAQTIRTSIRLPEPFTFTMTGRSDEITLRLGNTSDEQLGVVVRLESSKLTFPENDRVVTLRPNDSTDVQIPVRARSNGTSPVTVTVLTPLGEELGGPVTLTSRVNAFTGLGQVLTGAFILMLLTWWFSNWRRRRRALAATAAADHDDGRPDEPDRGPPDGPGVRGADTGK
ncbi:MAG: hypothetical protein HKN44_09485 [Ilumatobacter sp.]|nr:hypothetical protein [Ilumatobacter sp.]